MKKLFFIVSGVLFIVTPVFLFAQIVNGDFETGDFTGWTVTGPHSAEVVQHQGSYSAHVHINAGSASNSWTPNGMWERVAQVVTVPTAVCSLSFYMEVTGSAWHDGGSVWTEDTLGNYIEFLFQTGGGGGSGQSYPWELHTVDLSPYSGQKIKLCFGGHNWNGYGDHICDIWFDNVSIFAAQPESLNPDVTVITPNGGENWIVGQTQTITWTAFDSSGVVSDSVYYSTDAGSSWIPVIGQTGNPESYDWTIPNTPSVSCLVKVVAFDPWGNDSFDVSDGVFTIAQDTEPPSVTVISPNGGESWATGSVHHITWSDSDNVAVVADSIYYSTNGGASWIPVTYQTGDPQGYWWTVPNTPSTTCRVKIVVFDAGGLSAEDVSDGDFEIFYQTPPEYRYAIVVSTTTLSDQGWAEVVDSLISRHSAQVFSYTSNIWETQAQVSNYQPDYIGFVCQVSEASPSFVQNDFWPYLRQLDSDPYPDAVGGIITGCDATDALRLVTGPPQIWIKTVLGGTGCSNANYFPQGIQTNEASYGEYDIKYPDSVKTVHYTDGPTDRTPWLVNMLNGDSLIFGDSVDIFITSGHGNYNIWQLHYPSSGSEGYFRSNGFGHLYGDPYSGPDIDIISPHPKIYFGLGNCDIGQIFDTGCMAPAWIHNGGAYLYTGYVIPEGSDSYQHGATFTYFARQDHYSWPTAFMLGNCTFVFDLANNTPGIGSPPDLNGSGLYGDPALDARIPEDTGFVYDTLLYTKELIVKEGIDRDTITFRITMNKDGTPGYDGKWGSRSPICLFPFRIDPDSTEIIDMNADTAVVVDNFALLYIWYQGQPPLPAGTQRWVTFTTKRVTGIREEVAQSYPRQTILLKNTPNPFSRKTVFRVQCSVPGSRSNLPVAIHIYDLSGRLVKSLPLTTDHHSVNTTITWDGRNSQGKLLPSGIYFYRLTGSLVTQAKKLVLLR